MSDDQSRITALDELLGDKTLTPADRRATLGVFDDALVLKLLDLKRAELRVRPAAATLSEAEIEARLDERQQARAAKDFARSDAIRDELIAAGVEVMDGDPLRWEWRVNL